MGVGAQVPRTPVPCRGQVISEIVIRSRAPAYGGLFAASRALGRAATSIHVATAPTVIEHFLLFSRGGRCSSLGRQESERILRAQPFLADASVTAYAVSADTVRLEVSTVDEPAILLSPGIRSAAPYFRALSVGSTNLEGKGIYAVAGWRQGFFYRDAFLGRYSNYQLFRRPVLLEVNADRREIGYDLSARVAHPVFSDLQSSAWRVSGGASEDLIPFRSPSSARHSLEVQRSFSDVGGVVRVGRPGRLALVGATLSSERAVTDPVPVLVTDSGVVADSLAPLVGRYTSFASTRLNLLLGFRQVNFLRVTGFDALTGVQDVRRGVQIGATIGRGLAVGGSSRDEVHMAVDAYAGVGTERSFAAVQVLADGSRKSSGGPWDDLLLSGRLAWYLRPHPRHTIVASVEYGAGERQRLPFQLALGDRRGGVRGYDDAELGGARRLVGRIEERWRTGSVRGTADAGVALFADAGQLWAGDSPLGRDTPLEPSVGAALLAAVPPGSQRLWRVDLAFPLRRDAGARWVLRFSSADLTRTFWPEPNDLRRNRSRTEPVGVFTWP